MSVQAAAQLFGERAAQLLGLLRESAPHPVIALADPVATTGIGGSEGPARLLAQTLAAAGRASRFVPVTGVTRSLNARTLVLFSQALSPNARLAIEGSAHLPERILVTGTSEPFAGHVLRHELRSEDGLLVRVLAPTVAIDLSLRALAGLERPSAFFPAVARAADRAAALAARCSKETFRHPWAFVTCGEQEGLCHGLRWKWLETMGVCDPPIYDVLNFAHGPLQRWHGQQLNLLAFRTPDPHWSALELTAARLGHRLFALDAELSAPWSFFEYDIALNTLLLRALSLGIGHGTAWRGQGEDYALYERGARA